MQLTPDKSNLQGSARKVRVIRSSSYRELKENSQIKEKNIFTVQRTF